jgi:hypothetical protein
LRKSGYSVEQLGIRQAQAPRQLLRQIAASSRGALHHEYRLGKEAALRPTEFCGPQLLLITKSNNP